jgi:hypothetical protein
MILDVIDRVCRFPVAHACIVLPLVENGSPER